MPAGLYLHVPFCQSRCHFCAFYVRIHREDWAQAYLASLNDEIGLHVARGTLRDRRLDTVYFGGGTPTTLTSDQLAAVLSWIRTAFELSPQPEITIEAHPDSVTADSLRDFVRAGFTRMSFGIQSTNEQSRINIGRPTRARSLRNLVDAARSAGFGSINMDLIYGLPRQTREEWMSNVDDVLECDPDHISCYALTIEEHSHLYVELNRGEYPPVDEDLQNALEDMAERRLTEAGFERYEISNYAREGHACRHNLLYWQGENYLGLGPSAQSYVDGVRFGNIGELEPYRQRIAAGQLPIEETMVLTEEQRRREALVFGLRLVRGIPIRLVSSGDFNGQMTASIDRLVKDGLLEEEYGQIRLTREGRRLADSVAAVLF